MTNSQITLDRIRRIHTALRWGLHLLIAVLLILVVWRAGHWSVWLLSALFAAVYFFGALPADMRPPGPLRQRPLLWLGALIMVWAGLIWDGPEPAYLAFPLFFLIVMVTTPAVSAVVILLITAVAIGALVGHLGWSVGVATGPILGAAVAWTLGTGFRLLGDTVTELVDARAAALEASRNAGEMEERARIAGDIHDTVAQGLSSIQMLLHAAEKRISDPQARAQIQLARDTTADNLAETRNIIAALQPQPLVGASLPVALARIASTTPMGEAITFEVDGVPRELPERVDHELVRITQTLLGNVIRHSGASRARLTLTYQDDQILLDVLDNGRGFDPTTVRETPDTRDTGTGFGLPTARRRLQELGGRLIIESAPGAGTGISARIPDLSTTFSTTPMPSIERGEHDQDPAGR